MQSQLILEDSHENNMQSICWEKKQSQLTRAKVNITNIVEKGTLTELSPMAVHQQIPAISHTLRYIVNTFESPDTNVQQEIYMYRIIFFSSVLSHKISGRFTLPLHIGQSKLDLSIPHSLHGV
jgi:hypothetical protein